MIKWLESSSPLILAALIFPAAVSSDSFTEGGDAYIQGDYATALEKFTEVAGKGDHRAMYALGSMYAGGTGVTRDYKQAFKWFSEAARYGRLDAQYKLGLMYELGVGVRQDFRQAARYYRAVGQKGYAFGQFRFGQLYQLGKGVKPDPVKAYAWMAAARQNLLAVTPHAETPGESDNSSIQADKFQPGDVFTAINLGLIEDELGKIKEQLTQAQLEQAQQLAAEYLKYR